MLISDPDILMAIVDLVLIALISTVLVFMLLKGWLKSPLTAINGRVFAVIGIAFVLLAGTVNMLWPVFRPESIELQGGLLARNGIPGWLHWLYFRIAFVLVAAGIVMAIFSRRRIDAEMQLSARRIMAVKDGIKKSEERFRRLIEVTSDSVFCLEFNPPMSMMLPVADQIDRSFKAVVVECNRAFARQAGVEQPADAIGRTADSLNIHSDAQAYERYFKLFVENDYELNGYEFIYRSRSGNDRALSISLTGFGPIGYLEKIWGAMQCVDDLRQTRVVLQARRRFDELLAKISSRLVTTTMDKADIAMKACLKEVCLFLESDRITLHWNDRQKEVAEVMYFWKKAGIAEPVSRSLKSNPGNPEWAMKAGVIRIDDIDLLHEEAKVDLQSIAGVDLRSAMIEPLVVAGERVGMLSVCNMRFKRQWSDQEVVDLRVFAELFANFVLRRKSYQSLGAEVVSLQQATERLEAENIYLRQEIESTHGFDEIIGESGALLQCLHDVAKVATTNTPVLILGETGTGKELVARAVHQHSDRSDRPLVKVNCAALPENLIESELFGFEKGAFTGAHSLKRGRFDLANGGTLFLDEIGDIPNSLQAKLLRVLQEGEFERLGGVETIKVDVRLIVATNRNLANAVDAGQFRPDLYYRINTFPITLPSLRERGRDIEVLAEHFVKLHSQRSERDVTAISAAMLEQLNRHTWPGNVRELEGVIQRALISGSGPVLELANPLPARASGIVEEPTALSSSVADLQIVEREHILTILGETTWRISGESGAAARLGLPPSTLRSKMKKLSISRSH